MSHVGPFTGLRTVQRSSTTSSSASINIPKREAKKNGIDVDDLIGEDVFYELDGSELIIYLTKD